MLNMKVSHILPGKPWLFNQQVQHDGYAYANVYFLK